MSAWLPVAASGLKCSVHPPSGAAVASLQAMTKVTRNSAQTTALSAYAKNTKARVSEGELEAEHGCLVYSFDIRIQGKSGVDEVLVDAGNGKVLDRQHETPKQEADEAAAERKHAGA
ncbi:MAG: hypothetical protein ABJA62_01530 [Luteimonas sp.]